MRCIGIGVGEWGLLRSLPRLSWRLRARTQTPSITFRSAHGYSCQQCVSFPRVNVCFSRFAKTSLLPCVAILSPPFFCVCQLVDFCPVSACTITVTVVAVCSLSPRPRSLSCPRSMNGGELFDRLILRGAYTENEARQTFAQVAHGLLYLHGFVPVPPFALTLTWHLLCGPGTSM